MDLLARGVEAKPAEANPKVVRLAESLDTARATLNLRYLAAETGEDTQTETYGDILSDILDAERHVTQLTRDLERLTPAVTAEYGEGYGSAPDAATVCAGLPENAALLEYFAAGGALIAFVLTRSGVRAQALGSPAQIESELGRLNFFLTRVAQGQRYLEVYGEAGLQARIDKHLGALYDLLIRPLELTHLDSDLGLNASPKLDLIVVPHGPLQAVPFTALFSGAHYLIDDAHLNVAPSAAVYLRCRNRLQHPAAGLVAFGVPTEGIPGVEDEVAAIAELARAKRAVETVVGEDATLGVYRPDNPVFSGLRFIDSWLTARALYTQLYRGESVGKALRSAQLEVRRTHPNPYYWAAFAVIGDPERTVIDA